MSTGIYIVSGFLGAGKTTLIQKLLDEAFQNDKVALIENDFGEISVDSALLQASGVNVREMNAGCICCSLSGNFVEALKELLNRFQPNAILIEPSGVGKLSDVVKACADPAVQPLASIRAKITVVDVKRCHMYRENFGEFFEDQIQHADTVLFSRTEAFPERVPAATDLISELNAQARVFSLPWGQLSAAALVRPAHRQTHAHDCAPTHNAHGTCTHHHGGPCACGEGHAAEEVFETVTLRTKRVFNTEELKALLEKTVQNTGDSLLRIKGIVRGAEGYIQVQYTPEDLQLTGCQTCGDVLCFIGRGLNRHELADLFHGE